MTTQPMHAPLTINDAATLIGVPTGTLYGWDIPSTVRNGKQTMNPVAVAKYLKKVMAQDGHVPHLTTATNSETNRTKRRVFVDYYLNNKTIPKTKTLTTTTQPLTMNSVPIHIPEEFLKNYKPTQEPTKPTPTTCNKCHNLGYTLKPRILRKPLQTECNECNGEGFTNWRAERNPWTPRNSDVL